MKYYPEEHVTPHEEAYQWHLSNPKTGFVLEDNGRIAAFTDILPIRPEIFDRIANGTFNDKYLTAADMVAMEGLKEGDSVNLLLSCVLVDDDYRETDALKILLGAHLEYYEDFTRKGIRIGTVLTSNVTKAGERFSERMGFEKIGRSEHQTTLYKIDFSRLTEQVRQMKPRLEEKLLQFERNLTDSEFCRSMDNLNSLIASDCTEYGQSGMIYDREALLRMLMAADDRRIEITDFTVRCLNSSIAVAHYVAAVKSSSGKSGGKEKRSLRTSLWVREEDGWKLHFHQGTAIGESL